MLTPYRYAPVVAILNIVIVALSFSAVNVYAENSEIVIDAVVASVDGKPITLQDVGKRLNPPRAINIQEAAVDAEARTALEGLIIEKLIQQEAEAKKLGVSNSEIEDYIKEVAERNHLTHEEFEAALAQEHKSIEEYKKVLRTDILRSKLTFSYVRGTVAVTDEEIDNYMKEHSEYSKSGSKVKLSQVLVRADRHSAEEMNKIIQAAQTAIKDGTSFTDVAKKFSEGSEASEGGSLGMLAEEDLSREIFDAVFALKEGDTSEVVHTNAGLHIFKLEGRLVEKAVEEDKKEQSDKNPMREEVRKLLLEQKSHDKMASFFTNDSSQTSHRR